VIETAHRFGAHGGLAGVLCAPANPNGDAPAVVFSNVGLNHRVGPNRCWVELARALARVGFPSLRFDLSGFGDSEPRCDGRSDSERAALDLTEALDFLEQRGVATRFVLIANCSGVDSLHTVACRDPRVVGAVSIDGYAYRNSTYRWRRSVLKWLQPRRWRRWVLGRRQQVPQGQRDVEQEQLWRRDIPTRERFGADVTALVRRGVRLLFVFTGGMDLHYNHRGQFHDMFGHRGVVDVEFYPRFDHLLSLAGQRATVNTRIIEWMRGRLPS
jgi:pimeloyl-ACP methyl ester carboxylesterase